MATRIATLLCTLVLLIAGGKASIAGEYHYGQYLVCYDCHTMHFSQTHNWDGTTSVPTTPTSGGNWLGTTGPINYLLKAPANQLCLACHDGKTFAPDVMGANTNTYVRAAGAITTGTTPYENWKGHTLDGLVTPPGGTSNLRLECVNCHSPHGNANFRNLDGTVNPITYAKGTTNDTATDVYLRGWTLGDIANNYSVANEDFNEPAATAQNQGSAISKFCKGCHTDFHGRAGDSNMGGAGGTGWLRHPTADANIGAVGGGHSSLAVFSSKPYRVKVMSPSGDWGTQGSIWTNAPTNLTPNCLTCHKAHGNQNPFGLIFLAGTGPLTEEGDADGNSSSNAGVRLRYLCGQCHVQAN